MLKTIATITSLNLFGSWLKISCVHTAFIFHVFSQPLHSPSQNGFLPANLHSQVMSLLERMLVRLLLNLVQCVRK